VKENLKSTKNLVVFLLLEYLTILCASKKMAPVFFLFICILVLLKESTDSFRFVQYTKKVNIRKSHSLFAGPADNEPRKIAKYDNLGIYDCV
jgi:hypothetical protein